jgi:hypothetical protein
VKGKRGKREEEKRGRLKEEEETRGRGKREREREEGNTHLGFPFPVLQQDQHCQVPIPVFAKTPKFFRARQKIATPRLWTREERKIQHGADKKNKTSFSPPPHPSSLVRCPSYLVPRTLSLVPCPLSLVPRLSLVPPSSLPHPSPLPRPSLVSRLSSPLVPSYLLQQIQARKQHDQIWRIPNSVKNKSDGYCHIGGGREQPK